MEAAARPQAEDDGRILVQLDHVVGRHAAAAVDLAAEIGVEDRPVLALRLIDRRQFVLVAVVAVRVVPGVVVPVRGVVALDQPPRRRVVARRRQGQPGAVGQLVDRLHQALAPGRLADDEADVVILDGARNDLGGGGGAAVHEHDDRQAERLVAAGGTVRLV